MQVHPDGQPGSAAFRLVPVSGVVLDSIHYVVTAESSVLPLREGDLPTPGGAADFSFSLQLPAGSGYQLSLSASSANPSDQVECGGTYGPFSTDPGGSASFNVPLECHEVMGGPLTPEAQVRTDACPRVVTHEVIANPASAPVGGAIELSGSAYDLDGKPVVLSWAVGDASVATFSAVYGGMTTLTCNHASGPVSVTLTVDNGQCKKLLTTSINCN